MTESKNVSSAHVNRLPPEIVLLSLLRRFGSWLRKLDLQSFENEDIERFLPQIVEALQSLKNLEELDIRELNAPEDFVNFLPCTLRDLKTSARLRIDTLHTLSVRCPKLEEVPFQNIVEKNLDSLIELFGKFPRQKRLKLNIFWRLSPQRQWTLASIGALKALEQLELSFSGDLDGRSLEAIAVGCQRLRQLRLNIPRLPEKAFFHLTQMQNLTALTVSYGAFTDTVLMAIAQRGQLKKLNVFENYELTDESIVYLVDRCKSLVSLELCSATQNTGVTERSLEAIIAELQRRHGWPPRALPTGPHDPGVFYFHSSGIRGLVGRNNPWLRIRNDPREF